MRLPLPSEQEEDPGQFWKAFIRDTVPASSRRLRASPGTERAADLIERVAA